jgi:hypothetical protein
VRCESVTEPLRLKGDKSWPRTVLGLNMFALFVGNPLRGVREQYYSVCITVVLPDMNRPCCQESNRMAEFRYTIYKPSLVMVDFA